MFMHKIKYKFMLYMLKICIEKNERESYILKIDRKFNFLLSLNFNMGAAV